MKTAVDFLRENLKYICNEDEAFNNLFKKAKLMEKFNFLEFGYFFKYENLNNKGIEEYYNETFKSE